MNYLETPITNKFQSKTPKGYYDAIKGHTGEDRLLKVGTPISLPLELKCVDIRTGKEMGLCGYFEDKNGSIHVLAHNTSISAKLGQICKPDEVLCISGNTGDKSTAPHSHYEVIAKMPWQKLTMMTRTLGLFKGYNVPPTEYVKGLLLFAEPTTHWSDEAMQWAVDVNIITKKYPHNEMVDWGSFVTVLKKFSNLN